LISSVFDKTLIDSISKG